MFNLQSDILHQPIFDMIHSEDRDDVFKNTISSDYFPIFLDKTGASTITELKCDTRYGIDGENDDCSFQMSTR
jgi:hypothetical protein